MASLFEAAGLDRDAPRPLADRLRPVSLAQVLGQDHLLGGNGILTRMIAAHQLSSIIFWGPPGTGKTTVARLLAAETDLNFVQISAIFSGVQDLRKIFDAAKACRQDGQGTLLFIDEIHRFNRAQQDSFLPHMENGTIILIGATTENPSFELNSALLSRASVLTFDRLDREALAGLVERANPEWAARCHSRMRRAAHCCRWPMAMAVPYSIWLRRSISPNQSPVSNSISQRSVGWSSGARRFTTNPATSTLT